MTRIILTYGLISGLITIVTMIGVIAVNGDGSIWLGYLIMLIALSSILVGVRQYRDQAQGGVISFKTAFLLGLGIAVVASIAYVVVWEIYEAATHYAFMDNYVARTLEAKRAAGLNGAELQKATAELEGMRANYQNPLMRLPMIFAEIFPVGLLIAVVSAVLLRNPRFLPAKRG